MFQVVSTAMHAITNVMQIPVIVILLFFIAVTVVAIGNVLAEYFGEHRHMGVQLPKLLDDIRDEGNDMEETIENSGLLRTQKDALLEVTRHKDFTELMREALADSLLEEEQSRYGGKIKRPDILAKLGPMLGLMGTLIPLGPGIIALGQGDTYTLSQSLQTAFDTTIAGMSVAAVALVISTVRKKWYGHYMSVLETVMDCVVEMEKINGEKKEDEPEA